MWEEGFGGWLDAVQQHWGSNLDMNSGDPLGASVLQVTGNKGKRVSARSAFLSSRPTNLTIMTGIAVEKIVFEKLKACGVYAGGMTSKSLLCRVHATLWKLTLMSSSRQQRGPYLCRCIGLAQTTHAIRDRTSRRDRTEQD